MHPSPLKGELELPADKSITHRAILFSALAHGRSTVLANSMGRDNLGSLRIIRNLGVAVEGRFNEMIYDMAKEEGLLDGGGFSRSADSANVLYIEGKGRQALRAPAGLLDCGNSGTTARLMTGVLAGCPFAATLTGDESLITRPFKRVTEPLSKMGAQFSGDKLPLTVTGGALRGIEWISPKASAQVKSAILIAGLEAEGDVVVVEPHCSRDHTERMFAAMGCPVESGTDAEGRWRVRLGAQRKLGPLEVVVPGDYSAAAFFIVAACIVPGSDVVLKGVGVNPSRTGLQSILERMGAQLELLNRRDQGGEPVADIRVTSAGLRGVDVSAEDVVLAIDEIPVLAVAAAFAEGRTTIAGCEELRVKESDRIKTTVALLSSYGFTVDERADGMAIEGSGGLTAAASKFDADVLSRRTPQWQVGKDHRILMSAAVIRYALLGEHHLDFPAAVETSFPGFLESLQRVTQSESMRR